MAEELLDVDASTVLALRSGGPIGGPGMLKWGSAHPQEAAARGRAPCCAFRRVHVSGTQYGTCVLHVAPSDAVGGPLPLLHTGDRVRLDIGTRRLGMLVSDAELAQRRAEAAPCSHICAAT